MKLQISNLLSLESSNLQIHSESNLLHQIFYFFSSSLRHKFILSFDNLIKLFTLQLRQLYRLYYRDVLLRARDWTSRAPARPTAV